MKALPLPGWVEQRDFCLPVLKRTEEKLVLVERRQLTIEPQSQHLTFSAVLLKFPEHFKYVVFVVMFTTTF